MSCCNDKNLSDRIIMLILKVPEEIKKFAFSWIYSMWYVRWSRIYAKPKINDVVFDTFFLVGTFHDHISHLTHGRFIDDLIVAS